MALGVAILLMGVSIGVSPAWFLGLADWESQGGLYLAAAMRIISGLVLILGASASRYPVGLRIFGAVVLLAGLVLLFIPLDLWTGLIEWLTDEHATVLRMGGGAGGTLVGLFLVHAARPKRSATE